MRWLVIGMLALVALAAIGLGVAWVWTASPALPPGSVSASRLASGPLPIRRADFDWSRSANARLRPLPTTMWYPLGPARSHPLLVFSHGLMSSRFGCTYLAEHLATFGYVVVAADHPFTHAGAPGGPDHFDLVNQPDDLSFLIDRTLQLTEAQRPFAGAIDRNRIGLFGISLGADTVTLATFHPTWHDPRIAAAISIAGHGDVFGAAFFDHADAPFLMIAGTSDGIVDYEINAQPIPARVHVGGLLTVAGGTHAGFTDVTAGLLRILGNPDRLGCSAASAADIPQEQNPFVGLFGTLEQGLIVPARYRAPCSRTFDAPVGGSSNVMRAGRQHDITTLAVRAFFDSRFATDAADRLAGKRFLEQTLPRELPSVNYTPSMRSGG